MQLEKILKSHRFHKVTPYDINGEPGFVFDMSEGNDTLVNLNLNDQHAFSSFIFDSIKEAGLSYGIGQYNEDRIIYRRSDLFSDVESRSLHLGIDIWAEAGTPVYAPEEAIVHSFADNSSHGDYGPTIILQHETQDVTWYTLYGHLSKESLSGLGVGLKVERGQQIATLGTYQENVHWPPHLHFQIMTEMRGYKGDFPGVCKPSEKDYWLSICPDPMLVLK